ncbi:MAG: hypothetical protein RIQ94_1926, partial [Pseudomonadota bacterium]
LITQTPLLRTTKAYGQLLGRDFNPLAKLLLLRTPVPYYVLPTVGGEQFQSSVCGVLPDGKSALRVKLHTEAF